MIGLDEKGRLLHYCHCGKWGAHGFGYFPRQGKLGQWFCAEHKPSAPPVAAPAVSATPQAPKPELPAQGKLL
jgi:hypothetical protein